MCGGGEAELDSEVDTEGVGATNLIGKDKLLLLGVEEVVGTKEDFAVLDGSIAYLEVYGEAGVEFSDTVEGGVAALGHEVGKGRDVPLGCGFIDGTQHTVEGWGCLVLIVVLSLYLLGHTGTHVVLLVLAVVLHIVLE